jgi:hypothetical protein
LASGATLEEATPLAATAFPVTEVAEVLLAGPDFHPVARLRALGGLVPHEDLPGFQDGVSAVLTALTRHKVHPLAFALAQVPYDLDRLWSHLDIPSRWRPFVRRDEFVPDRQPQTFEIPWSSALAELPEGLTVFAGDLRASGSRLERLPEGLWVEGACDLKRCEKLEVLPRGMVVTASLCAKGCSRLREVPPGLKVGGWLEFAGCASLETLPDGLKVGGGLNLAECKALRRLPAGLVVATDLDLRLCLAWDGVVPPDAVIGGKIITDRHPRGVGLVVHHREQAQATKG